MKKPFSGAAGTQFAKAASLVTAVSLACVLGACGQTSTSDASSQNAPAQAEISPEASYRISHITVSESSSSTAASEYAVERDGSGNITAVKLTRGENTSECTYQVDEDGRVSSATIKRAGLDADNVTYFYDESGRLMTEAHDTVYPYIVSYEYDAMGNLVKKSCDNQDGPYAKEYSYDSGDRLTSEKSTSGSFSTVSEYMYGTDDNLSAVRTSILDADNNELSSSMANYTSENGGLVSLTNESVQNLLDATFAYDNNGNITSATIGNTSSYGCEATFTYDGNGLLTQVEEKLSDTYARITTISYESVSALADAEVLDLAIVPQQGAVRALDSIHAIELNLVMPGVVDPTPLASESSFILGW